MASSGSFRIAAIQASSVFLDRDACIAKACGLIQEAADGGTTLAVFPEAFVPCFPVWVWFIPSGRTHPLRALFSELHRNAITIPGPETKRLGEAAADCGVTVVIGVNERNSEASDSTLYDTILYIGPDGEVLGKHRKLIPTTGERLVWGQGAEAGLDVFDLPFGRLGGLLCWENYMPLARYALAAGGEQIHAAPTWDRGEPWISSMRHVAKEGRCSDRVGNWTLPATTHAPTSSSFGCIAERGPSCTQPKVRRTKVRRARVGRMICRRISPAVPSCWLPGR